MRKWLAIPLVLIVALVMMVGSCGKTETTTTTTTTTAAATTTKTTTAPTTTTSQPTPTNVEPYGQINVAITDFSSEATDPTLYESIWGWAMYDSLITTNSEGKFIGEVAKSWTVSPDGLT